MMSERENVKNSKMYSSIAYRRLCVPGDDKFVTASSMKPTSGSLGHHFSAGRIGSARPGIFCLHMTTSDTLSG